MTGPFFLAFIISHVYAFFLCAGVFTALDAQPSLFFVIPIVIHFYILNSNSRYTFIPISIVLAYQIQSQSSRSFRLPESTLRRVDISSIHESTKLRVIRIRCGVDATIWESICLLPLPRNCPARALPDSRGIGVRTLNPTAVSLVTPSTLVEALELELIGVFLFRLPE